MSESTTMNAIMQTQVVGLLRATMTLPFDHFFDRIKTEMQTKPSLQSPVQTAKNIYLSKGLMRGLYAGYQPSFFRYLTKGYYRWPMMILIPNIMQDVLPISIQKRFPILFKSLTGLFIGMFESLIICPLERLKIFYMTRDPTNQKQYPKYYLLKSLYNGFQLQTCRQMVSWTSFLYWDYKTRHSLKSSHDEAISYQNVFLCSIWTSLMNIIIVHPFDTIKTLYQMENNEHYRSTSVPNAFKEVYQRSGVKGFYYGWQMRIVSFFCTSMLTTPTIDYLERQYGKQKIIE